MVTHRGWTQAWLIVQDGVLLFSSKVITLKTVQLQH